MKDKPVLKSEKVLNIQVEYHDLDAFIKAITGRDFQFVADQECGNDSQHSFTVDGTVEEEDLETFNTLIKEGKYQYSCSSILNVLCSRGYLEAGEYLIFVCW